MQKQRKRWIIKIREGYKETLRHNKRPYTTLTFDYANEAKEFLKSVISYGGKPLDLKIFYDGMEA